MFRQWPFLIPFVSMASGLTVSVMLNLTCSLQLLVAIFACLFLSLFHRDQRICSVCATLFFFAWGLYALVPLVTPPVSLSRIESKISKSPVILEGLVAKRPTVGPDGSRLVVNAERLVLSNRTEEVFGALMLNVAHGDLSYSIGDRIRFKTTISFPRRLGLPGEFDYPRYLSFQGISAVGRVASQHEITLIRGGAEESFQRNIDVAAKRLGDVIREALPDDRISSVITALLLGDQKRIPKNLADAYTRAGVNHILSISGFHVGIIAAFISLVSLWVLKHFELLTLMWNVRQVSVILAVPSMLFYLFLTGNAPATARSVIMLIACALALYIERESDSINALLVAAFFLIAIDPATLFDISFQLSFLSLWGIIIAVPALNKHIPDATPPWAVKFIQFIAASVAATFTTLIPVLYVFKVASFNGILTNFLIVPLLGYGAVIAGFCVLPLISVFPAFSNILLWPTAKLIYASNKIVELFSTLPVMRFPNITSWDMLFFLLLMSIVTFVESQQKRLTFAAVIPFAVIAMHLAEPPAADNRLHITMLSVGQCESLLLRLPDGSNMLVDGGGYLQDNDKDFGQRILLPALESLGVRKIERIILTHDHPDHIGGLSFVVKNMQVGSLLTTSDTYSSIHFKELKSALQERQVQVTQLSAEDSIKLSGGVVLDVLSPSKHNDSDKKNVVHDANEESLVFRISYGDFSMLFTADAGFDAEHHIITQGYELKSTVLKVGHHGSGYSTSDEFINLVQPRVALISVGAANSFGLPSGRTLDLLKSKRIEVYRTDLDGTVELISDGSKKVTVNANYRPK